MDMHHPTNSDLIRPFQQQELEASRVAARVGESTGPVPSMAPPTAGLSGASSEGRGGGSQPAAVSLMGARLGRDFSRVRVHADTAAADLAESAGARALTRGTDIYFGSGELQPETEEGQELIAHELTHVAQQEGAPGGDVTQTQPKQDKKGIGYIQPSEPFETGKGTAQEDIFVLFPLDSADLSGDAEKKVAQLASDYIGAVVVEVDGYASTEGDIPYNLNLSAHRAIAVKKALLPRLPAGSEVHVIARGETKAFGGAENNRRVGVRVIPGAVPGQKEGPKDTPSPGKDDPKKSEPWTFDPTVKPRWGVLPDPSTYQPRPDPNRPTVLPSPFLTPRFPKSTNLLDWSELRAPFTSHGLTLDDRDMVSIELNWQRAYAFLLSVGFSPDMAAWGATKGTAHAYDDFLSRENPNAIDRFEQDKDKLNAVLHPGQKELKTPIIPIITPTTMNWITKTIFGKDVNFEF